MNLYVRFRLNYANSSNYSMVQGTPVGGTASTVTINDVYGQNGASVNFERSGLTASVSCSGNPLPPGCPHSGYWAWKYSVSGTQTVTVRWAKKTLQLYVTPIATKYEGDSVTFTAASTDGRAVTVSNWMWRDTTGVSTSVPCGYSPVCRWVPPNTGIMYVRGKVGTNPFYEQASAYAEILPMQLVVEIDSTSTYEGELVKFTARSAPGMRPVTSFALVGADGLEDIVCTPTDYCEGIAVQSDSLTLTALVNGRPKALAAYVEVLPCPVSVIGEQRANRVAPRSRRGQVGRNATSRTHASLSESVCNTLPTFDDLYATLTTLDVESTNAEIALAINEALACVPWPTCLGTIEGHISDIAAVVEAIGRRVRDRLVFTADAQLGSVQWRLVTADAGTISGLQMVPSAFVLMPPGASISASAAYNFKQAYPNGVSGQAGLQWQVVGAGANWSYHATKGNVVTGIWLQVGIGPAANSPFVFTVDMPVKPKQ